jgi:hypothetical protein
MNIDRVHSLLIYPIEIETVMSYSRRTYETDRELSLRTFCLDELTSSTMVRMFHPRIDNHR